MHGILRAEKLAIRKEDFELRLLRVPEVATFVLWLHSKTAGDHVGRPSASRSSGGRPRAIVSCALRVQRRNSGRYHWAAASLQSSQSVYGPGASAPLKSHASKPNSFAGLPLKADVGLPSPKPRPASTPQTRQCVASGSAEDTHAYSTPPARIRPGNEKRPSFPGRFVVPAGPRQVLRPVVVAGNVQRTPAWAASQAPRGEVAAICADR